MVLPYYGNTHTETSYTGRRSTRLRELARRTVRESVGAGTEHAVIFCGSGATAAIEKFARLLELDIARPAPRPVVFVGPYEHHSNDLIWREWHADVVRIPLDAEGVPDLGALEEELVSHADRPLKIGAFAAASNVTGMRPDLRATARLLHRHGAIMACDHAASGPYIPIDMRESAEGADDHLDAVFLSPHKFTGGPGSSGVLVVDRKLANRVEPSVPGGGTVSYVTAGLHRYVADLERREEAGTPAILANIRAGMALRLKDLVGAEWISAREHAVVEDVFQAWQDIPEIEILGPRTPDRLAIFSFNIRSGEKYLHHNLVVALLNDLFGIQARGGCSCAGPYGHYLLGLDDTNAMRHEALVIQGKSLFRPGWTRLGFTAFQSEETRHYVLEAVRFIAKHGFTLMRLYDCDRKSGLWRARWDERPRDYEDLAELFDGAVDSPVKAPDYQACLDAAHDILAKAAETAPVESGPDCADEEAVRWFWWPGEAGETTERTVRSEAAW